MITIKVLKNARQVLDNKNAMNEGNKEQILSK